MHDENQVTLRPIGANEENGSTAERRSGRCHREGRFSGQADGRHNEEASGWHKLSLINN